MYQSKHNHAFSASGDSPSLALPVYKRTGTALKKLLIIFIACFALADCANAQTPGLYINEVSQGPSGNKEYVELIAVGTPTCFSIPTLDLRGWILDDNNGFHATGSGTGIAQGCIRLSQDPMWAAIPIGTLIVIYNDADFNASVPSTDLIMNDGNCRLVIPVSNCQLLEKHTTLPSTVTSTYPTTGYVSCGNWNNVSMANADDSFQTITPAGALFHSVSWGNNTLLPIIYFAGSSAGQVSLMTNATGNNISTQANWSRVTVAGNESPGTANNTANQNWICSMNNGCVAPTPIVANITHTNASCTCTGSATVTATGGFNGCGNGYTYSWSPSGGNAATATGLCAGSYSCTVTDVAGCSVTVTVAITATPSYTLSSAINGVTCFGGNNGSATVTPAGGTSPFTYSWSPSGGNASTATGLSAGTYTVTVIDAANCTNTIVVTITQPNALTSAGSQTNLLCNAQCNGSATVTPAGGTGPYSYSWAPSGGNAATASGLCAGTYTCTITDANGCTATRTFSITQPPALTGSGTQTNVTCNAQCTGSASVIATGGTGPYSYVWTPSGGNASTAAALCAGTYTCSITDANGCATTSSFTITQPPAITGTSATQPSTCGNSNGTATVTPTGGTGPYNCSWAPSGGNAQSATNLAAGTYTITVTDANGCTGQVSVTVTNTAGPTSSITSVTNASCFAAMNGSATITPSGGTGPFGCNWTPSGGTGLTATGLGAGTYTATITDANGCVTSSTVVITQPQVLLGQLVSQTNVLCNGGANGSATAGNTGGTGPYSFNWLPSGGTNPTATGLTAGTYTAIITDANGCTAAAVATITEPPVVTATMGSPVNVLCNGGTTGSATVTAGGGVGAFTYNWLPSGGSNATASNLGAGTYTVTVTDGNGCAATTSVTITEPLALTNTITGTATTCNVNNGSATVTPAGGTGPYTYNWLPSGGSNATASALASGNYTVTVTDANNCQATASVTINPSTGVSMIVASVTNATCAGDCNAQATVTPFGGTSPYTIAWPSGGSGLTETGLCAGGYTVHVTDFSGCTSSVTVTVTEPLPLAVQTNTPGVLCIGQSTTLTTTTTGGTPAYTEVWSPAGPTVSPNATTTYTVVVTDANGCNAAPQTVTVNVNLPLAVVPSAGVFICPGNTAALSAAASGGDGNYTYTWLPTTTPATGPAVSASPGVNTTYTVVVTDGCGSTAAIDSITVTVSPLPAVTFAADTQSGCMPLCVTFTNTTPNSSLCAWDFGDSTTSTTSCTPQHCYSLPGSYDVNLVVTDGNGCSASLFVPGFITVYPLPHADFSVNPQPATLLDPVIYFTDESSGAAAWSWDFGDPLNSTSVLQNATFTYADSGHYAVTLTVTNIYGCTDDTTVIVDVELDDTFYAPNCFTPDGDGTNDVFYPKGSGIDWSTFEMLIFDRWGNLIYKTTDINKPWDGRVQGKNAPAQIDVYVWVVNYETVLRKPYTHMGHISLVR